MKRLLAIFLVIILLLLSACSTSQPVQKNTVDEASAADSVGEQPDEEVLGIDPLVKSDLEALIELSNPDYECDIFIQEKDDGLTVSVSVGENAVKVIFADVIKGTRKACYAFLERYDDYPIAEMTVKNGSDDMLYWSTKDLETGQFIDASKKIVSNKTFSEIMEYCGLASDGSLPQGGGTP